MKKNRNELIALLIPETSWVEIPSYRFEQVLQVLREAGPICARSADYLRSRKIKLGYVEQYQSGAGWTLLGNIALSPSDDLLDPFTLCLITHEVFQLMQSIQMRLSIQGALRAWQYHKRTYRELTGKEIGGRGQAYQGTKEYWDELGFLSSDTRDDLLYAQSLMKKISPSYRADVLPLFPLSKEISFLLKIGKPIEAFRVISRLTSG